MREEYEHLMTLLASRKRPPNAEYSTIHGEFDETLTTLLDSLEKEANKLPQHSPSSIPLDIPHTPMSTISRLMKNEKCEVLINFMHDFINRFLTFDNEANEEGHYDRLFGTENWRTIIEQVICYTKDSGTHASRFISKATSNSWRRAICSIFQNGE